MVTSKAFLACLFMLSLHVVFAQGMAINVARTDIHQMSFTTSDASYIACCIGMCFYYKFLEIILYRSDGYFGWSTAALSSRDIALPFISKRPL
jgi:hypothetical protein